MTSLIASLVLCLLGAEEPVAAEALPLYQPHAVAVRSDGSATIDLAGGESGSNYLVLVGSLAKGDEAAHITMSAEPVASAHPIALEHSLPDPRWLALVRGRAEQMKARRPDPTAPEPHAVGRLAATRSFHLFVREHEFLDTDAYKEVTATLVAVGKHCLVYLDEEDHPESYPKAVVDEIVAVYDNEVYPKARAQFGNHRDVDRNGKFTILLTHWLGKLADGKVSLGGFVRGGDFHADVAAPFSNQCDMMYLNSSLRGGQHLRTILAHEYTHAITFSEHTFGGYLPGRAGEDEESWLSEAIAHLAENNAGTGWSNLDYRVSAYLSETNRYRLVVPDYFRAGLWRCHGSRGVTYLFLRWCVDRFGPELLRDLSQSALGGVENLEAATRVPFAELFRGWTAAVALSGLCPEADHAGGLDYLKLRDRLDSRLLAGPRTLSLAAGELPLWLAPTSFQPVRVTVPAGKITRVRIASPLAAATQVTLIRLPEDLPEVELDLASPDDSTTVRLVLRHRAGAAVHWRDISWERTSPGKTREGEQRANAEIRPANEVFLAPRTKQGQITISEPIHLVRHEGRALVFKALGHDDQGRSVTAWRTVDLRDPLPTAATGN